MTPAATTGKWTIPVLNALSEREHRCNELRRSVGGAPSNVLSERLKQLKGESIVTRTVADTSPPAVTYSLTDRGVELARVVDEIEQL